MSLIKPIKKNISKQWVQFRFEKVHPSDNQHVLWPSRKKAKCIFY